MAIISRGFRGKRETDPRIPPGQYLERGFPVLSAGPTPRADLATWTFSITADAAPLKTWTWSELTHLPHDDIVKDIHCVTKWSKFDTEWTGVRLADLLGMAGPLPGAAALMQHAEYGYSSNVPLADALRPESLLADGYDGRPLDPRHGYPARTFIPHLYLWKSVKWVRGLEVLAADAPGFWERNGYHMYGDPFLEQRFS